jgi:predicted NBD/HSP70 family sugar kinase
MRWRRNTEINVRELERRAAAGDPQAQVALAQWRLRNGHMLRAHQSIMHDLSLLDRVQVEQVFRQMAEQFFALPNAPAVAVWSVSYQEDSGRQHWGVYGTRDKAYIAALRQAAEVWEEMDWQLNEHSGYDSPEEAQADFHREWAAGQLEEALGTFNESNMAGYRFEAEPYYVM